VEVGITGLGWEYVEDLNEYVEADSSEIVVLSMDEGRSAHNGPGMGYACAWTAWTFAYDARYFDDDDA
jgi:hypothetical protein